LRGKQCREDQTITNNERQGNMKNTEAQNAVREYLSAIGSKGGAAGRGPAKARTSAQAAAAVRVRWEKARQKNSATQNRIIPASKDS
jgi:hypothetical protein